MPKAAPTSRLTFRTYRHLLSALIKNAMMVLRRIAEEMGPERRNSPSSMDIGTIARNFALISGLVRRTIVVSRYINTLPIPTEEREHRIGPALDRAFHRFGARKRTIAEYDRAVNAEIDGDLEDEFEDALPDGDIGEACENDPYADVPGRPPSALVAELCRDFGMIAHSVPTEWLTPMPGQLRLLCARAAAASIRPSAPALRVGRAVQH